MQMQGVQHIPITDVRIVTQKDRRPSGYFILEKTIDGHDGQLFDSTWRHKGKRYLCFSRETTDRIIEDLTVIGDDDTVIPGFSAITKAHDDDDKAFRKHVLCLKIKSRLTADTAVCDIVLVNRTKGEQAPPGFHLIGNDINDLSICFKTVSLINQQPPATASYPYVFSSPPHSLGPNLQQWKIQSASPWQQQQLGYQAAPYQAPYSAHVSSTGVKPAASSAIEGLPFHINPKFEVVWKKYGPVESSMQNLSMDDIESKYSYDFCKEKAVTSR